MKSKTILLSIHPCFVEKIFTGEKLFEYRKNIPTDISYVIIYATVPVKNIVAFVEVDSVLKGSPKEIWEKTKHRSGVTEDFFMSYFSHKNDAYAIRFKDVKKLSEPKSLSILKDIECAPQSFSYITESLTSIKEKFDLQYNQ
jgi:predicted transcriptional regulator